MPIKCRLSTILGEKRMTRSELTKRANVSINTLRPLWNDDWKGINRDTMEKICGALGITPGELFVWSEE